MQILNGYLPTSVNQGPWVASYTLHALQEDAADTQYVLPVCSLGTPYRQLGALGDRVLPPLFYEALTDRLKDRLVDRVRHCFPHSDFDESSPASPSRVRVVDLPVARGSTPQRKKIVAFSVDTAVEEHGPHLPLATDTIQSYSILNRLAEENDGLQVGPPVEYGQLTWGLPFGFSIDLTAELLTEYVARFADAVAAWLQPEAMYVVDVHGSIVHRRAIVEGLRRSRFERWGFRWLHEPLAEFASARNDQHAGGVETALVEHISPDLLDPSWWPERLDDLAAGQMSFATAVELTPDLPRFAEHVRTHSLNGIVGDITNYRTLDAQLMFDRMLAVARGDVERLLCGDLEELQTGGESLW